MFKVWYKLKGCKFFFKIFFKVKIGNVEGKINNVRRDLYEC